MGKSLRFFLLIRLVTIFFFYSLCTSAQVIEPIDTIDIEGVISMNYDADGNLYVLNKNSFLRISDYSPTLLIYPLTEPAEGFSLLTRHKTFLFQQDNLITLNNQLIEIGEKQQLNIQPVCITNQNFVIGIDAFSQKIVKLDLLNREELFSQPFYSKPLKGACFNNNLYILLEDSILVYDDFFNLKNEIKISATDIITGNGKVYALQGNELINVENNESVKILPGTKKAALHNTRLAVSTKEAIIIFSIKK